MTDWSSKEKRQETHTKQKAKGTRRENAVLCVLGSLAAFDE